MSRLKNEVATEYWKDEICTCSTCKVIGKQYDYDIANTHQETDQTHSFFEVYDFEKGVAPS